MALEVFRSSYLSRAHERIQMDDLMKYLKAAFDTKDERCRVVIGAKIPVTIDEGLIYYEFDVIVFKDNKIVIVDLKNIGGKIRASCFPGGVWEADSGKGYGPIPGKRSPFEQAKFHRIDFCRFLWKRLLTSAAEEKEVEGGGFWEIPRYLDEHVSSWVVTAQDSIPKVEGITYRDARWFKVLPLEGVTRPLEFEREGRLLTEGQFQEFLNLMDAIRVPWNEWHRGLELEQVPEDRQPKNRVVSGLLGTRTHENLLLALNYIRNLDFRQYIPEVNDCFHNKEFADVRLESLKVLMEWEVEDLSSVLTECLTDPSPQIVSFALGYLTKTGIPETFPALANILRNGPSYYAPAAITAMAVSGHSGACDSLFEFAKSRFGTDGFQILKDWAEALHSPKEVTREEYYSGKRVMFMDRETQLRNHLNLFATTCHALGSLRCGIAISWLEDFLTSPRRVGLDRDTFPDYGEDHVHNCHTIFRAALSALGQIDDHRIVPLLLERLTSMNEDYQESIVWTLGEIGDPLASEPLIKYLETGPRHHHDATVHALGLIGGENTFNALAKCFVLDPLSQSGRWTGKALERIDRPRFEALLLEQISSEAKEEFKREFLQVLLPIASPSSVEVLFQLLKDPVLSERASRILANLASRKSVFKRAMRLTRSDNAVEKASAILVLEDYLVDHLDELAQFEGEAAPVEVRRAVTGLYYVAKATDRLRKYAEDPDSEVRSIVFWAFADKGKQFRYFYVCSTSGLAEGCAFIASPKEIVVRIAEKLVLIPTRTVSCLVMTKTDTGRYGVYLRARQPESEVSILLVPTRLETYEKEVDNYIGMVIQEFSKVLPVGTRHKLSADELNAAASLWSRVPIDLKEYADAQLSE